MIAAGLWVWRIAGRVRNHRQHDGGNAAPPRPGAQPHLGLLHPHQDAASSIRLSWREAHATIHHGLTVLLSDGVAGAGRLVKAALAQNCRTTRKLMLGP